MKVCYEVSSKNEKSLFYETYLMALEDYSNRIQNSDEEVVLTENVRYWDKFKRKTSKMIVDTKMPTKRKIGFSY